MRRITLAAILVFITTAAALADDAGMKNSLLPAPAENGFAMPDYYLWCPSVVKVGNTYHMFATRWPAQYGMGGWTSYAECVRATSDNLLGPYEFQEVVLQKRPDKWDYLRVCNARIVQVGDTYVLYYSNSTTQTGYAWSKSITGPWTRSSNSVMRGGNPAVLVRPDKSVYVINRRRVVHEAGENISERATGFTAKTFDAPYSPVASGKNLQPAGDELESPCIWWAHKQINVLVNDRDGKITGVKNGEAQYYSADGVKYTLASKKPVFDEQITYADGKNETAARRGCAFVYQNEKGEVVALFTAIFPQGKGNARIIAQPVQNFTPSNKPASSKAARESTDASDSSM